MPNDYFRFKQFTVRHDSCAMKVGTDGVLLGAWADCINAGTILDVGTGSGLIALMLAQRSRAEIDAVDIDKDAFQQSSVNFKESPFADRVWAIRADYRNYPVEKKYDLIVSNPPYFTESLQSPDKKRTQARHNHILPFDILVQKTVSLLSPQGKFALIIPATTIESVHSPAKANGLYLIRKTNVKPTPTSEIKRVLLEYAPIAIPLEQNELIIEISRHVYSEEYKKLTRDFYLKM